MAKEKKRTKKVRYVFSLGEDQLDALKRLSSTSELSIAQHVRFAISQYLGVKGHK